MIAVRTQKLDDTKERATRVRNAKRAADRSLANVR